MSDQQLSIIPKDIIIQLEIVSEDEQQPDSADVEEVSREIVDALRSSGYTVEPTYTGTKGGPAFDIVVHIYNVIHDNEALLTAVFMTTSSILQCIMKVRDWRAEKEKTRRAPIEITVEVNSKPLTIKASDVGSVTELLKQLQRTHPEVTKQVLPQTNVKTRVQVPKKKRYHAH